MAISLQHQLRRSLSWKTKRNLTPVMPAHTFTQSAALVQVCTPVESNSELWRSQTLDVSNSSPNPTASTSSEEKSCQGSWNRLDCSHLTVQRQRKPVNKKKLINTSGRIVVALICLHCPWYLLRNCSAVLGLVGMELTFFTADCMVLGFVFVAKQCY